MKLLLVSKGLWNAISGEEAVTIAKEQQTHAAIVLSLADSQLMHVIGSKVARDAWGEAGNFYGTQDMATRLGLKEKLSSFKYTASIISSHVTKLEEFVPTMQSENCGPSEEDICAMMLRSLPPSYDSLVKAFRMVAKSFKFNDWSESLLLKKRFRVIRRESKMQLLSTQAKMAGQRSSKVGDQRNRRERVIHVASLATMHKQVLFQKTHGYEHSKSRSPPVRD